MKVCTSCKKELPDDCFHKRKYSSGNIGLQPKCKKCSSKRRAGYYKPEDYIKRKFNLSESEYQELIQHNSCQVCGKNISDKRFLDHCQNRIKIRGVLCNNCNTALGLVNDNVQILSKLIQYLEQ